MKIRINNFLFYAAYILSAVVVMCSRVHGISRVLHVLDLFSIFLFLLLFLFQNFLMNMTISRKRFLLLLGILCVCLVSYFMTGDMYSIKLFLVLSTFRNIEVDEFIKKDFIIKLVLFIAIILFYNIGWTEKEIIVRADGKIRSALGFSHANIFGNFLLVLCLELVYLLKGRKKIMTIFILLASIIANYCFADSRASLFALILCLIFLIFNFFEKEQLLQNRTIKFFITHSFLIFSILSLALVVLYNFHNPLVIRLNSLFSTRIYWASTYIQYYGINLFGSDIYLPQNYVILNSRRYLCVDMSYIYFLLKYGIIIFSVIAILMKKLIQKMYQTKNYYLILIFLLTLIYGLMETYLLRFQYNPFLIILGIVLINHKSKEEASDEKQS